METKRPENRKPNVSFRNVSKDVGEILLYDEIGYWGITAKEFATELKALGDVSVIKNHINSPGGDVFEAAAIYQLLAQHAATVETHIDGMAMSAATVVALAGDTVAMAENGLFMIHDPMTIAIGNKAELLKVADVLEKVTSTIVGVYTAKTGSTDEAIRALMAAETYFTAAEAVAAKFVDSINPNKQVAASWQRDKIVAAFKSAAASGRFEEFNHEFLPLVKFEIESAVNLPKFEIESDVDWVFENMMLRREIDRLNLRIGSGGVSG